MDDFETATYWELKAHFHQDQVRAMLETVSKEQDRVDEAIAKAKEFLVKAQATIDREVRDE